MSTFLELVQDTARQSGTLAGGVTLASVAGVTGRADKLVNWVKRAWEDVQNQREWDFLKAEFEGTLTGGTRRYTAASFNLTRFKRWESDSPFYQPTTLYDPDIGQSDETALRIIAFDVWRASYDRGEHDSARPVVYAISPAGELCFGPTPDKTYTLRGEYRKAPLVLAANGDTPEAPAHLHQIIVHRAMVLMGGSDESPITITTAQNEYRRLFAAMCNECLPGLDLSRGNSLA
jgi:hypothetical protein